MGMIFGRPEITKDMGRKRFLEFYYLENEMIDFCRKNGLDPKGGRKELAERIADYIGGGGGEKFILKPEVDLSIITDDTPIELDFELSSYHTQYFEEAIGEVFMPYEDFIIWMEENAGRTYSEAVEFWYLLHDSMDSL